MMRLLVLLAFAIGAALGQTCFGTACSSGGGGGTTNASSLVSGLVSPAVGGTGVDNGTNTVTLGGPVVLSGAGPLTINAPSTTSFTPPGGTSFVSYSILFGADGAGSAVVTGGKRCTAVPYNGVITNWMIVGDVAGSVAFDIQLGNSGSIPTSSIVASAPPVVTSSTNGASSTLTGWTTTLTAGQNICVSVTTVSVFSWCNLLVIARRT